MLFKFPNVSPIGKVLQPLATCTSTNDWLRQHQATNGTVVYTMSQTHGKGQRGNQWHDVPGCNLAFSLLLQDLAITASAGFLLNKAVALAVHDVLAPIAGKGLTIKWPNDIYWHGHKLAGILLENTWQGEYIHQSIIGIGINADVAEWPADLPLAISLRQITGKPQPPIQLVQPLVAALQHRLMTLHQGETASIQQDYHRLLYQLGMTRAFISGGGPQYGCITGVNDNGQLLIDWGAGAVAHSHGTIEWVH